MSLTILLRSYVESDPVGKAIFFLLFLLSIITWIVVLYKIKLFLQVKKEIAYLKKNPLKAASSRIFSNFLRSDLELAVDIEFKRLTENLFILQTIVSLAPFVGILGTVWGILISLFEMRTSSASLNNSAIISGLSTALGTTVIGLVIAIPALIAYNALKNASRNLCSDLEQIARALLAREYQ